MTKDKIDKIKPIYLYILLTSLIFRSINIYSLVPSKFDSLLFSLLVIVGSIFLLLDFFNNIKLRKFPYNLLLILFLIIFLVSSIVNREFGIFSNLKLVVWSCIYFFFSYNFGDDNFNNQHFFKRINMVLIISWFIVSLLSLVMFLLKFGYEQYTSPRERLRVGFLESRLFGLFGDPNYGATVCLIVMILLLFYLINDWKKLALFIKIFYVANLVIQFSVLILSGSRSALLISFIVVGLFVFFSFIIFLEKFGVKRKVLRIIFSFFLTILVLAGYSLIESGTKKVLQTIPEHIGLEFSITNKEKTGELGIKQSTKKRNKEKISLTRKDVAHNEDISNMRFSIWKSGIEIFKATPWVGTSPRNLIAYAHKYLPNTFIAQKSIVTHNLFINVLASTGIFGFLIFVLFLVSQGISVVIFFFKNFGDLPSYFHVYLSIIIVLILSGLFNNELILVNTIGTFLFWLYLGNLNGYMKGRYSEKSKIDSRRYSYKRQFFERKN